MTDMSTQHFGQPLPGYNVILPALKIDLHRYTDHLNFFQVTMPLLVHYVMSNWPIFTSVRGDDEVYEFVTDEISYGTGLFRAVRPKGFENDVKDMLWFEHYTGLMEIIYQIRDQLMPSLRNFIDTQDEACLPNVTCRACRDDAVVVHVQPELAI